MPITIWRRIGNSESKLTCEHNHFDNGHIEGIKPVGHPSWPKYSWMKSFGYLINHVVIN